MDPMTAYLVTMQRQDAWASRSALPHAAVTAHDLGVRRPAVARAVVGAVTLLASRAMRRSVSHGRAERQRALS
jgi:hypothetical protein